MVYQILDLLCNYTTRCEIKDLVNNICSIIFRHPIRVDIRWRHGGLTSGIHQQLSLHLLHHSNPSQRLPKCKLAFLFMIDELMSGSSLV